LCIFFFCAGHAFIPLLGLEDDETLFAQGIYQPRAELYSLHIGRSHVPIMLMSYLGALKSLIYGPIVRNLGVSLRTVREPMLLAGVASLWLFFLLLRRAAGNRAALIGCALLASDSLYLLTTCFDWGPVALQHLLLIGGALALVRFFQERSEKALAAAGFLFGLALWDKALAVWIISGLAVGGLVTFPRQIFGAITIRRVGIATLALVLGALPLILYNVHSHGGTFSGNFQRDTAGIPGKVSFLAVTLSGDGLFGWMMDDDWQTPELHRPQGAIQKASAAISALARRPRHSLFLHGFLLALLLAPLSGRHGIRLILLALVAMAVAWIQMAINQNTGGSIHHTILLWPLPQFIVAVSFSAASYRVGRAGIPAVACMTAVLAISGALVMNEYFVQTVEAGGAQAWTDAIFPLSRWIKDDPAHWALATDWGIADQLRLLHRGRLHIGVGTDQISKPEMTDDDRTMVAQMISIPGNIFIAHTPPCEIFPGNNAKLIQFAAAAGYRREMLTTISDSYAHPVYEVYRFVKSD
jgi:hypothetical protein